MLVRLKSKKVLVTVLCMTILVWGFFVIMMENADKSLEGANLDGNDYLQNLTNPLGQSYDIHTLKNLTPAFKWSEGRSNVTIVLGIPTVKRDHSSYLHTTLRSIFENIGAEEESDTLVIILIAETEHDFVTEIANDIKVEFSHQLESGILEIICPPLDYYPDWSNLEQTHGK